MQPLIHEFFLDTKALFVAVKTVIYALEQIQFVYPFTDHFVHVKQLTLPF